MLGLLTSLRSKAALLGAGLLTLLAFFVRLRVLKSQRDKAVEKAAILAAQERAEKIKQKIKKEEDINLSLEREEIKKEVKKEKREDFEGIDNLTNPND